jgi:hypothetical protein
MISEKQQSFATCFSPRKRRHRKANPERGSYLFNRLSDGSRSDQRLRFPAGIRCSSPPPVSFYMFHLQTIGRIENAAEQGSNPPVKPSVLLGLEETNKNRINNVGANLNRR